MKDTKDSLGNRMKEYEYNYKLKLPKRMPVLIRIDGKAFHTYTRGMEKPFDEKLIKVFWETCKYLAQNIMGCKVVYHQSDEISILITNYEKITTESWFDNNLQKLASVSASMATAKFNEEIKKVYPEKGLAVFDARVWVLPDENEVVNYFYWRQKDATKNSISMVAQANFPHKQLQGLNGSQLQDKLFLEKGINWNDIPVWQKRGACIVKAKEPKTVTYQGEEKTVERNVWTVDENIPIFSQDRGYIGKYI